MAEELARRARPATCAVAQCPLFYGGRELSHSGFASASSSAFAVPNHLCTTLLLVDWNREG